MKQVKKVGYAVIAFSFVLLTLTFSVNDAESQVVGGFIPVTTDCYTAGPSTDPVVPEDVGDSNNCTPSKGICADNTCPAGTMEVQRLAGEDFGGL